MRKLRALFYCLIYRPTVDDAEFDRGLWQWAFIFMLLLSVFAGCLVWLAHLWRTASHG